MFRSSFNRVSPFSLNLQSNRLLSQDRLLKLNDLSHIEGSVKTVRVSFFLPHLLYQLFELYINEIIEKTMG